MSSNYRSILNAQGSSFASTNSFNFDGNFDYITTNSIYSELDGQTKATFSLWVKPTLGSTGVLSRVSSTTSTSAFVYQFYISSIGEVAIQIGDTTRRARTGSTLLTDGIWSHILVCYDGTLANGSKTKIFINGEDKTDSDSTTATSLVNGNYPLSIGRRDQTPTYYYDGFMDELAMWSSTDLRNQSDVDTIYNGGIPNDLNNNGLAAPTTWFRMGEAATYAGGAWTLVDQGSGGNDGTSTTLPAPPAQPSTDVPT